MQAIYFEPGEFELLSHDSIDAISSLPIEFRLQIYIDNNSIELDVTLSDTIEMIIKRNTWLDVSTLNRIQEQLNEFELMDAIEFVKDQCQEYLLKPEIVNEIEETIALKRIWFYLVSLSTKSKREDLVQWAPDYQLTGFVIAGKPGILCLEGSIDNIDSYISDIKSRSWADVPSHQKKISIVLEEEIDHRLFLDMQEITNGFEMGGVLGNRPNMTQVKKWFQDHGIGHAFNTVIQLK
jgi:hypothetical protein